MGFMNLEAARARMATESLDALVLLSPRHTYYATGYRPWFLSMYAETGYAATVVPADPAISPAALVADVEEGPFRETAPDFSAVVTYPTWVTHAAVPPCVDGDGARHLATHQEAQPRPRAGLIDRQGALRRLVDLLHSLGLANTRLGVETAFLSAPDRAWLASALPRAAFPDATGVLEELRALKSDEESTLLRRGTRIAERAIGDVAAVVRAGMTGAEMAQIYRAGVMVHADGGDVTGARITLRVGPDVLSPWAAGGYQVQPGDTLFLDCGVEVAGYWADIGRTFTAGPATPVQRQIYQLLREGFDHAVALVQPGRPVADVFVHGMAAVHAAGLTTYDRGNLGHGVGLHPAPELPIVCREEPRMLTAGHVLSVEFPYYIDGIGAFTVEDTFAIRKTDVEVFNELSHDLVELEL